MSGFDFINAMFEGIGAASQIANCYSLHRDKQVRGVYWPFTAFFASWGFWNLFYYSHLLQWWSLGAGAAMAAANVAWVLMALYYRRR